jgi:hypothetical protein
MGASSWSYFVEYQPDLDQALDELRQKVFAEGKYWWAHGELGKSASAYQDRPTTMDDLFEDECALESGTHSILDVSYVLADGEEPDFGTVQVVTGAEALRHAGTERLTRDHVRAIHDLASKRWFGRCAGPA